MHYCSYQEYGFEICPVRPKLNIEIHHKDPILLIRHLPYLRYQPNPPVDLIEIIRNLHLLLLLLDLLICFLI
jgi:hypothetical protein